MADVRVRGAVSTKSSKKRHKMVVTDDKVRVGRTAEAGSADDEDDDFDDADDVDGDFDDADADAGDAGGVEAVGAAAPDVEASAAATSAEAAANADATPNDANDTDAEPADEPSQEGAVPMTQESTPVAATVRPLHDRILVKRLDAEQKTPGGLFIPDNAKEKPVEGLVVAVGNGVLTKDGTRVPLDVKAGDRVLFSKYSGNEVKIALDGGEHLILREDDILAVLETTP